MAVDFEPLRDARPGCVLCREHAGVPLWQDEGWRVIRAEDADFPAFYRVIARHHVGEFSALLAPERQRCMDLVCVVERVLIERCGRRRSTSPRSATWCRTCTGT